MKKIFFLCFILVSCAEKENHIIIQEYNENSWATSSNYGSGTGSYNNIYPIWSTNWMNNPVMQNSDHFNSNFYQGEISPLGWKITLSDDFDTAAVAVAKGADPSCFSRTPHCMINWWGREACPEYATQLKDLNKCTWDVYNYYNYMDYDAKEGEGINSFHPNNVEVINGNLILSATRSMHTTFNCKKPFTDPRIGNYTNYTIQCPYFSGGVESKKHKDGSGNVIKGFAQEQGRFEVRAKLNMGDGAWPAHWLLPENPTSDGCGWPQSGEIDIMEAVAMETDTVIGTFHTGDCAQKNHLGHGFKWKASSQFYPLMSSEDRAKTWYSDFHIYAVEWSANHIRFLVDNVLIGQISEGDFLSVSDEPVRKFPIKLPKSPFYWILNTTIVNLWGDKKPDPNNFPRQEHIIDYVKTYRACTNTDSGCQKFTYQNLNPLCPGMRTQVGTLYGKNLCKAIPDFPISRAKCQDIKGIIAGDSKWCAINEGAWYKARSLSGNECTWPREYLGDNGPKPVCKAFPHFSISNSNCGGNNRWNGYCLWDEGGWYKARRIK
jgi:hypothetical protein